MEHTIHPEFRPGIGEYRPPRQLTDPLPPAAREKYQALVEEREDAHAAATTAADRAMALNTEFQEREFRLNHLHSTWNPRFPKEGNPSIVGAEHNRDEAAKKLERARQRQAETSERWHALASLQSRVDQYLRSLGDDGLVEAHEGKFPALKRGQDAVEAAGQVRLTIDKLRADLHATRSAPRSSSTVRELVRAQVNALAERGRASVFRAFEGLDEIQWPQVDVRASLHGLAKGADSTLPVMGAAYAKIPDALGLCAWLNRDALLKALDKEIAEAADDGRALSDTERAAREADLLAQILDAERHDCHLVEIASGALLYRPDADPRAMLDITGPALKQD